MLRAFDIPISWSELVKRTVKEVNDDDILGRAAQLAYYLLLALVPAMVFLVALTSFLPGNTIERMVAALNGIAPPEMVEIVAGQLRSLSAGDGGGLATFGFLMALWSSSAALVAIIDALNGAYDIKEGRPWWKVRLTAIGLTIVLGVLILVAFTLVLVGPFAAEWLAGQFGFGSLFEWAWKILQWPVAFALVALGLAIVNYYGPDAEQEWVWVSPGSVVATTLWLAVSLLFRVYVVNFGNYNETYGALGGVIVLMLWLYISGLAILAGAELNAEIEHASPHGKDPGEKRAGQGVDPALPAARVANLGGPAGDHADPRAATAARAPATSGDGRPSEWLVGLTALGVVLWAKLKKVKSAE
jgi:membrane protein